MSGLLENVAPLVERLALRTPTLPPATETNTYLVGDGRSFIVVEPAPPGAREQRALFECVRARAARGETLRGALVTHHHRDHVGAAAEFRTEFGVPLFAHARTRERLAGTVPVDRLLSDGETLFDGALRVLLTPGHAPGHLCLWHERDRWLIAGDMVASVGTILIDPDDDGDMAAYLRELARLEALAPSRLFPAHGDPIDDAVARLAFYQAHRRTREGKVLDALDAEAGGVAVSDVVRRAYDDTSVLLWPLAAKSARAHLAKLVAEGRAREAGGRFSRVA